MDSPVLRRALLLLCACFGAHASAAGGATWSATGGTAQIEINRAIEPQYGLRIEVLGGKRLAAREDYLRDRIDLAGALTFEIANGHYAYPATGALGPLRVVLHAGKRERRLSLRIVPAGERGAFALVDARGQPWFGARDVHQAFDAALGRLAMTHLDLRTGPALARWLGRDAMQGQLLGTVHLMLDGPADAAIAKAANSCHPPEWPGTPGGVTDVALDRLSRLDVYCNQGFAGGQAGLCDGNGTHPDAKLKFLPSVRLSNAGTTDVPWYIKFSAGPPQEDTGYPYATPDQHPFLVWNVYRVDADGRISQIGRSGVKHAFFTGNEDCPCNAGQILFASSPVQCADTYDAGSNDRLSDLGPRREVIASRGVFGRCESIFDPDCNGQQNPSDPNPERVELRYRAPIHESEFAAALHPGAQWFIEAWYVVRDDANLYNTMANRRFSPNWLGFWQMNFVGGETPPNGAVIDRWVAPGSTAPDARNTEVVTANGRIKLAVRVVPLGEGRYRYDYAVMNFEYADPVTSFAEPNLRIDRNHGLAALRVPVPEATTTQGYEFHDGDAAALDWTAQRTT
ncbi:MAG TPA: hypothetical protein VFO79_12380, partial [Xanthomonadales bacterium]|nr:hypothetical protein [Xanthomonadales bacterium]